MGLMLRRVRSHRILCAIAALVVVSIAAPVTVEASESNRSDRSYAARAIRLSTRAQAPTLVPVGPAAAPRAATSAHRCGAQSAATIAGVDVRVAHRIYEGEVAGTETFVDQAHVRRSSALLNAMSSGNAGAILAAVHAIVYTPHWHIVRLRVMKGRRVIADVGGPYVIAPVSGVLARRGRAIGRYVMSVQDDLGYVKLISRFIGVPVDLYQGRSFVMGTLQPAPPLPSSETTVIAGHGEYRARVLSAESFPDGLLNVALLIPTPSTRLSSMSCQSVLADAWGAVAMHIAARFKPLSGSFHDLVGVVSAATGGSVFVTSGGHLIAGGGMPVRLPLSGSVTIHDHSRAVFSWLAAPRVRVYMLAPA